MRAHCIPPFCLLLAGFCFAQQHAKETQWSGKSASGAECVRKNLQAARKSLEEADRYFVSSNTAAAHIAVDATVRDVGIAVDCSLQAHKAEKDAEIGVRELSRRMNTIRQALDIEERPYLGGALGELEKQRDRLLYGLFGDAYKDATEKKP